MSLRVTLDQDTKALCESAIALNDEIFDRSSQFRALSMKLIETIDGSNVRESFRRMNALNDSFRDVEKHRLDPNDVGKELRTVRKKVEKVGKMIDQILKEGVDAEEKRKAAMEIKAKARRAANAVLWATRDGGDAETAIPSPKISTEDGSSPSSIDDATCKTSDDKTPTNSPAQQSRRV